MITIALFYQIFLLFASIHISIADQFNIKDNEQPDIVLKNGATNAITLDCLYEIDENQSDDLSGFTVKWFYQNDVEPIYQWIPDQKSISVRGPLEKFIVVNYSVSDELYHSYRALRLINLQTNMSGIYKCVVSTFTKEEYQYQKLVIYEPEKSFDIIKINEGRNITIICSANTLFPEPKITILLSRDSEETVFDNIENVISQDENGFFNITAIALYQQKLDQPVDFKCLLEIEEADYKTQRDLHYYPDHALSHLPSICLIVASLALLVLS